MLFSRMDKAGFAVFHKIAATQGKPFKIYERKGFSQDVKAKEKEKEKAKDIKEKIRKQIGGKTPTTKKPEAGEAEAETEAETTESAPVPSRPTPPTENGRGVLRRKESPRLRIVRENVSIRRTPRRRGAVFSAENRRMRSLTRRACRPPRA